MRKDAMKLLVAVVLSGCVVMPLSGCGQKTVKLDQAEETVKVEDTVSAKPEVKAKVDTETAETAKAPTGVINEGAGAVELLETPPIEQNAKAASQVAELVAGSRTSIGLLPLFFDFDKAIVRPDQVERIESDALFLKGNPEVKVRIEGNCDDRGTNEYNMALGERRAMGAMKYLVNLGVAESRLSTLSYGEERPLASGNDEKAWSQNRRDDFVIVR
jgi:peptidoglycan-associated lipoprotein